MVGDAQGHAELAAGLRQRRDRSRLGRRGGPEDQIGWTECAVGALAGTGLDGGEQMDAVFLLSGHIRNTRSASTAGTQPWTADSRLSPTIANVLETYGDPFPALVAAAESAASAGHSRDNGWEFGLQRILDGLEALIAKRSSAR